MADRPPTVLIVEDGDEYRSNFSRLFGENVTLKQVRTGAAARAVLKQDPEVDLLVLDLRFDRIPREDLVGDIAAATRQMGGDAERAWKYLEDHQGLFILRILRDAGLQRFPTLLLRDFSHSKAHFRRLQTQYGDLHYLPETAGAEEIRGLVFRLTGRASG